MKKLNYKFHSITPVGKIPHRSVVTRRLKHNFLSNANRRKTACTGIYVEHVLPELVQDIS